MLSVQTYVETCTAHRLMNYNGRCAHLHGHNYKWQASLLGPFTEEDALRLGILIDFSEVKETLNRLTDIFDHATVLHQEDSLVPTLIETGNRLITLNANPTAENLAWLVASQLYPIFGMTTSVELFETSKCSVIASFRRGDSCPIEITGVYNE